MKKMIVINIILVIFICGLSVLAVIEAKKIESQATQMIGFQKTIGENNQKIISLSKKNASESAQITTLLNQPTPTPIIKYQTQTVTKTQYVTVPGQTEYYSMPQSPVTYHAIPGSNYLYGSNGSSCHTLAGSNYLYCSGGY